MLNCVKKGMADTLAGLCIASAGATWPYWTGMAIGGMYTHAAHGESLAMVYPACTKFTYTHAEAQYATMVRTFNSGLDGVSDTEAAKKSVDEITCLLEKIDLYKKLKDVNVPESEIPDLAKQCMVLPDYKGNPRVANETEMLVLVKESY